MLSQNIFRQYDIRGTVPDSLNADVARTIANTFGWQTREKTGKERPVVTVGRDVRLSSDTLFAAVAEGLTDAGCDVVELGAVPTPYTYFSAFHLNPDAFLMITGSHNPPEYNGMKLGVGKTTFHSEKITALYDDSVAHGYRKAAVCGSLSAHDIAKDYKAWTMQHFAALKEEIASLPRPVTVVVDAGNGAASSYAPALFEMLGVRTIPLFCTPDGSFPNHHPDPTVEENLEDAKRAVLQHGADFAVAYDGDADRIGVVDDAGGVIWGDMLLAVYTREIMRTVPNPTVIADVKASKVLFDHLESIGARGVMWKTGHSLVKDKLKEEHGELAGEMSGHVFFAHRYFGYDDAVYASLRLLEAYVHQLKEGSITRASELLKGIPQVHNTPELRFDTREEIKFTVANRLRERFREHLAEERHGVVSLIDIDGVRVNFADGWGLLRASNTQPVLVMRFEATSKEAMNSYHKLFKAELEEILNEV